MFVTPISSMNRSIYSASKTKKAQKPQEVHSPQDTVSFKRYQYATAFAKYFDGPMKNAKNEQTFKELMSRALQGYRMESPAFVKEYFEPGQYKNIMYDFRFGKDQVIGSGILRTVISKEVYRNLRDQSYRDPHALVTLDGSPIVSIVNFGYQGTLADFLFQFDFKLPQDTRICFHGIDKYEDCIICLGKDVDGIDSRVTTKEGIGAIVRAGIEGIL